LPRRLEPAGPFALLGAQLPLARAQLAIHDGFWARQPDAAAARKRSCSRTNTRVCGTCQATILAGLTLHGGRSEGRVKPSGKTEGAKGLAHVLEVRRRKDSLTDAEAVNTLREMVRAVAVGTEVERNEVGGSVSVKIEHDGYRVGLVKIPVPTHGW